MHDIQHTQGADMGKTSITCNTEQASDTMQMHLSRTKHKAHLLLNSFPKVTCQLHTLAALQLQAVSPVTHQLSKARCRSGSRDRCKLPLSIGLLLLCNMVLHTGMLGLSQLLQHACLLLHTQKVAGWVGSAGLAVVQLRRWC